MIIPKKSKFCKHSWRLIKDHCEGWRCELHHECGKQYEKLAYLRILTPEQHRGKGHKKFTHGIDMLRAIENINHWKAILGDDFEWFEAEGLVCD